MHKGENTIKIVDTGNSYQMKQTGKFRNTHEKFLQPHYWGTDKNNNRLLYDGSSDFTTPSK